MNLKTHDPITSSGTCSICSAPTRRLDQETRAFQMCAECKPVYEQYDSVQIIRAYSNSGKNRARILVFTKLENQNNHCLLRLLFQSPEEFCFKSEDAALTAGKAKAQALLGEDVRFEEVEIKKPTDQIAQAQLRAGITKNLK